MAGGFRDYVRRPSYFSAFFGTYRRSRTLVHDTFRGVVPCNRYTGRVELLVSHRHSVQECFSPTHDWQQIVKFRSCTFLYGRVRASPTYESSAEDKPEQICFASSPLLILNVHDSQVCDPPPCYCTPDLGTGRVRRTKGKRC